MNTCCTTESVQAKQASYYKPAVDLIEDELAFRILADVPGASSENIEISLEQGVLTVLARVLPRDSKGIRAIRNEYGVGDYQRTFRVGEEIDQANISAQYSGGVLTITLPKAEAARPRRIEVRSN